MAIKPDVAIGLAERKIGDDERRTLDRIEHDIDDFLKLNYDRDTCPYYLLTEHLSVAATHDLLRRYRAVGWNVMAWPNGQSNSTLIYFVVAKGRAKATINAISGTH
jgi:hypothetical protein